MNSTDFKKVLRARKRIPGIEDEILANKQCDDAVQYADWVIRGRWHDAEPMIMRNAEAAARYAETVIRGRWPEAEGIIIQSPRAATFYASRVMRERWRDAEEVICKSDSARYYARDVLAGRWDEQVAAMCSCWLLHYSENECDGVLPEELHNRMVAEGIGDPDDQWVKKYLDSKKKQRVPRPR